jgi:hypothetical protein
VAPAGTKKNTAAGERAAGAPSPFPFLPVNEALMRKPKFLFMTAGVFLGLFLLASRLAADVIETKSGARIVGKITKIDGGSVTVTTDFAGVIVIKQNQVVRITTDLPVVVRLASGTEEAGPITTSNGAVQVVGTDSTVVAAVDQVAAAWPAGGKDPALVALEHHWKYEATLDIEGTTGNGDQLGTQGGLSAKLITPQFTTDYYTAYNRQVADGVKSADQFKIGVDYTDNLNNRWSWYARDEAGFDRIMDIKFYDIAATGYGYDLIKTPKDTLTFRAGLAYRYDDYEDPTVPILSSAAADFEIIHDYKTKTWEIGNHLTLVPAFSNIGNVTGTQDSFFQEPLANPAWKLRIGVANDYNSKPGPGINKVDTTYYTRLLLDWQ